MLTFLDSVGRRSEAELYLRLFREVPRESFAIIALEAPTVSGLGASLSEQLRFLANLGLFAPIVVGVAEPSGARAAADRFMRRLGLVRLEANVYTVSTPGVVELVKSDLRSGVTPILAFNEDHDDAAVRYGALGDLCASLESRKVVIVRQHGALGANVGRDAELAPQYPLLMGQNGISVINLVAELELLQNSGLLDSEDRALLEGIQAVFAHVPDPTLVFNITGPFDLLKELFTVKGAGTVVRRGTPITKAHDYSELDLSRLTRLVESSFGRRMLPGIYSRPLLAAYIAPEYHGAALLEPSPVAAILSKFVVDPVAQGEGMGRDIWQAMIRDQPSVIWRARSKNPICSWYAWQCDGMVRRGYWTVYWRGVEPDKVPEIVDLMLARPDDLVR